MNQRWMLESSTGQTMLDPEHGLMVGRDRRAGLAIADLTLSRRHFEMRFVEGAWQIEDLMSASGTYVNGALARGATKLARGDEIRAGQLRFKLIAV